MLTLPEARLLLKSPVLEEGESLGSWEILPDWGIY